MTLERFIKLIQSKDSEYPTIKEGCFLGDNVFGQPDQLLTDIGIKYSPKPQTFQLNFVLRTAVKVQTQQQVKMTNASIVEQKTALLKNANSNSGLSSKPTETTSSSSSHQSYIVQGAKKTPQLADQRYDLLCPCELKISMNGDNVEIRVRCEHPDLYLFSEFKHDRRQWSSFTFQHLKRLLAGKDWPAFNPGCYVNKTYHEDDDSLADNGIKFFLTTGKPEFYELIYVMTKPVPRANVGIPSTVSSTKTVQSPAKSETPKLNFKFCGECGARNSSADKFCGKCGGKI
jgi:ribosomal protein L40E